MWESFCCQGVCDNHFVTTSLRIMTSFWTVRVHLMASSSWQPVWEQWLHFWLWEAIRGQVVRDSQFVTTSLRIMTSSLTIRGHLSANKSSECHESMGKRKNSITNQWVDQKYNSPEELIHYIWQWEDIRRRKGLLNITNSGSKQKKNLPGRINTLFLTMRGHLSAPESLRMSTDPCVAACCGVLQCDEACCRVLQRVAFASEHWSLWLDSLLQCVAARCTDPYDLTVCWSVLQCDAVCCSVLQCVALCCSVLQRVALIPMTW